ncbi:Transposase IS4 [Popillia japonica]|uniref:Transposase IS4 n=1 Tax=Popillia japonica TaxID=7064 RepID=A0AAW1J1M5_POPJA
MYTPADVQNAKLKKGEVIVKESPDGVTIIKWTYQRDVRMLTTCHIGTEMVQVQTKRRQADSIKPKCVIHNDSGKFFVDVSDQLASYNTALRRCTKCYRKLMIEIIWGTALVNAYCLYCENTFPSNKITISEFREKIIMSIIMENRNEAAAKRRQSTVQHHLIKHEAKKRARCSVCYQKYGKHGTIINGKKKYPAQVITICDKCDDNPHFCKSCFNEKH